jgi:large subunit ribosomal protein L31e
MAKKEETKPKIEREYVIPLREKCRPVPRYKKTPKAIKTIKEFLARHMKVPGRDLNKIKLDMGLNETLWARGIKNPPHKVKVKVVQEGDIVRAEVFELSKKLTAKKARLDKREKTAEEVVKKKKAAKGAAPLGVPQSAEEGGKTEGADKPEEKTPEDVKEEKEKKSAVVEAGEKLGKAEAKKAKHTTSAKAPKSKRPVRQALAK